MRIRQTVLLAAYLGACATPAKEQRLPAGASAEATSARPAGPLASGPAPPPTPPAQASAAAPASSDVPPSSPTGSAYLGCGVPIPAERLWDETTEAEVLEAINAAKQCAASSGRRLMLEFVAPWCGDCREMARLDETPIVSETLRARFERVRINVGKWDRHEALRENYRVRALATYVVIDPQTSRILAQTTLEPITGKRRKKLTAEEWAEWLKTK